MSAPRVPDAPLTAAEAPSAVTIAHVADRLSATAAELAADYKAQGLNRDTAYDRFVIDRALRPDMGKREFAALFDDAAAIRLDRTETVPFRATHHDTFLDCLVMATPTAYGHALVWDFGMDGGEPGPLPDRYQRLPVTRESLMAWGYEAARGQAQTDEEKRALRHIIDRWIMQNGTPATHTLHAAAGRSSPRFYWLWRVATRWWRRYGACVRSC